MNQARQISIEDLSPDCPVPLETLGAIYRAGAEQVETWLDGIPESTRARLAVYLYGRSHTHELGIRVAASCDGSALRRAGGIVGNALYVQSRGRFVEPSYGGPRASTAKKISLGGSRPSN